MCDTLLKISLTTQSLGFWAIKSDLEAERETACDADRNLFYTSRLRVNYTQNVLNALLCTVYLLCATTLALNVADDRVDGFDAILQKSYFPDLRN